MIVFTDNVACAESFIEPEEDWGSAAFYGREQELCEPAGKIFTDGPVFRNTCRSVRPWRCGFIRKEAPSSHFDLLIELYREKGMPASGLVCLAASGIDFHGQRKRPWVALEGNLHLTAFLSPQKEIAGGGTAFPVLAAVSLVETIDAVGGFRTPPEIKWVNDILIGGAKVAGFLVHTFTVEKTVSAVVLGIGLNVTRAPRLSRDRFVTETASLRDFHSRPSAIDCKGVLSRLLERIGMNYGLLLEGRYSELLDLYRKRSMVLGRRVRIRTDPEEGKSTEIAAGKVLRIGEYLDLWLSGRREPVTKGRLMLDD